MNNTIDWDSNESMVLINPALNQEERENRTAQLLEFGLEGHIWMATSGTSAPFKFVALSKNAILTSAEAVNLHLESSASDTWLLTLPTFHVGGLGILARAHLSGARVIPQEKWSPDLFLSLIQERDVTLSALVPTQVYDLVTKNCYAPTVLRSIVVGGGALSRELYDRALALGWPLLPSYGLTECASQVATAKFGEFDSFKPLTHVELRVDSEGYLWILSPSIMTCYGIPRCPSSISFLDPKENGWFRTEDRAEIVDGRLHVVGRSNGFIKIGGEGVNLTHLQKTLNDLRFKMSVIMHMAIGRKVDDRLGHVIHLAIEGESNPENETMVLELIQKFNEQVMPYERIRGHNFIAELQRTPVGKLKFFCCQNGGF